jgi:regulatory protein
MEPEAPEAPEARSPKPEAYLVALKLLAARELSEAQIRQRLLRREYGVDEIDAAVARLKAERALDDARVAGAIARRETAFRKRGKLRVQLALSRAGIERGVARRAIDETFGQMDSSALIEAALAKRLRGRQTLKDHAEFARLYRYLAGQGFDADEIRRALNARRRATED